LIKNFSLQGKVNLVALHMVWLFVVPATSAPALSHSLFIYFKPIFRLAQIILIEAISLGIGVLAKRLVVY
jgi:hypothetical protein